MKSLSFIVALWLVSFSFAWATMPMDIVFDIDQTIATLIHEGSNGDLLAPSGKIANVNYWMEKQNALGEISKTQIRENYRVYDGLSELLQDLKIKQQEGLIRISFYSGGNLSRNISILEKITLADGTQAKDLAFKILGREEMVPTGLDTNARIRERFKKELTKINPNLDDVIIIDDIKDFVPANETGHVLWLDEKFPYPERITNFTGPLDKEILKREREKMKWIADHLISSIEERIQTGVPLSQIMNKKTQNGFLTPFSKGEEKSYQRGNILLQKYKHNCITPGEILSILVK